MSTKMFSAKDIEKYLGINANTLYHWIQTRRIIKPTVTGHGRGKRNLFSIDDLLDLYIAKILFGQGIDLGVIKTLMNPKSIRKEGASDHRMSTLESHKTVSKIGSELLLLLLPETGTKKMKIMMMAELGYIKDALWLNILDEVREMRTAIVINVSAVINDLEKIMGMKL